MMNVRLVDRSVVAALLLVTVSWGVPVWAASRYVSALDPNCSAWLPGAGTLSDPWKNLYYATTHLACGDTLYVRGGTYRIKASGFIAGCSSGGGNGQHSLGYFTQKCTAATKITVQPYNGETVIIDGTSTEIDDASPASHWTRCESPSRCGGCSGLSLSNYTRTFYSEPWNFGNGDNEQMWIDPDPRNPLSTGTRLKWVGTSHGSCSNLNSLTGDCFDMGACGTFDTGALDRAMVARLPDSVANADPDAHVVKISSPGGTAANHLFVFDGATFVDVLGGRTMYFKYGYYGLRFESGASDITIEAVRILPAGGRDYGQCVRIANGNNITIKNSVCAESAAEGIAFYGGNNNACIQIEGNVAHNNTVHDTGFASSSNDAASVLDDGIIIKSCSGCTVRSNTLYNNGRTGVKVVSDANGSVLCSADNTLIEGNRIYRVCNSKSPTMNSDCAGIDILRGEGSVNGTVICNNIVRDMLGGKAEITPRGIKVDGGVGNTMIANNSLYNIAAECIDTNENTVGHGNFVVRNNAMYNCSVQAGTAMVRLNAPGDWIHSNNTFWDDLSGKPAVRINSLKKTYSRDQVVSAFEPTAVQANPEFVSAADLHLRPTSPLIDAGAPDDAPPRDIDATARPQGAGYDVGAHELVAPPALLSVEPAP
jgi:parallel beta-helix repeat protein